MTHENCPCEPPFCLHSFPSKMRFGELRKVWVRALNRVTKRKTPWQPGSSDMVCSEHFVGGRPTAQNSVPTLKLGYEKPAKRVRRQLIRTQPSAEPTLHVDIKEPSAGQVDHDHPYISADSKQCEACNDKNTLLDSYRKKVESLNKEKQDLKAKITKMGEEIKSSKLTNLGQKPFSTQFIKKDADMKFYTGIQSIKMFNAIFQLLKPYIPDLNFWKGEKHVLSHKLQTKMIKKTMKVAPKDQFLLVLMRLRLGLLTHDLAHRFNISVGTVSKIFATCIKFLSSCLADPLVHWLPREVIT